MYASPGLRTTGFPLASGIRAGGTRVWGMAAADEPTLIDAASPTARKDKTLSERVHVDNNKTYLLFAGG